MYKFLLPVFYSLFFIFFSSLSFAQNGGYSGLFAPSPDSSSVDNGSSGGFMLPPEEERIKNRSNKKEEPAGYYGLIQGAVKEPDYQSKTQNTTGSYYNNTGEATPIPNAQKTFIPKSGEDVKFISGQYGIIQERARLEKAMKDAQTPISPEQTYLMSLPRQRIDGQTPMENFMSQRVKMMFDAVESKNMSEEERDYEMRKLKKSLIVMADAVRGKASISDAIYKKMGVPNSYIREEKEGGLKSLEMINNSIRQLQGY